MTLAAKVLVSMAREKKFFLRVSVKKNREEKKKQKKNEFKEKKKRIHLKRKPLATLSRCN